MNWDEKFQSALRRAFLQALNDLDLFDGGNPDHVRAYPVNQDQLVLQYDHDGLHCQAAGVYSGTPQRGEILVLWARTRCGLLDYGIPCPYPRPSTLAYHHAVALAT